jgi:hypothetical protein
MWKTFILQRNSSKFGRGYLNRNKSKRSLYNIYLLQDDIYIYIHIYICYIILNETVHNVLF